MAKPKRTAVPPLVKKYMEREEQFESPDECRTFLLAKVKQGEEAGMAITPTYIAYMMGCEPNEARAMLRWVGK